MSAHSAATKHFSRFKGLCESTVHSIRSAYKVELEYKRKRPAADDSSDDKVRSLPGDSAWAKTLTAKCRSTSVK